MKKWMLILLCVLSFSFSPFVNKVGASRQLVPTIGFVDKNKDGINELFKDANGDGINDVNGLPYPHLFGFKDDDGDKINDIFKDADGDGINDYDASFVDNNGDGINDNVIDTDDDNRNDITGGIVIRFTAKAKKISKQDRVKVRKPSTQETDVFIDRGDGFNGLLKEEKKGLLLDYLSRSVGGYLGGKGKSRYDGTTEESRKVSGKKGVVNPDNQSSTEAKGVKKKNIKDTEDSKKTK